MAAIVTANGRTNRFAIYRPLGLALGITGVALLMALAILIVTSWSALQQVEPVRLQVDHLQQLREALVNTQELLMRQVAGETPPAPAEITALRRRLEHILAEDSNLAVNTPERLRGAQAALRGFPRAPRAALSATLTYIRAVIERESAAQAKLIRTMHDAARKELSLAAGALFLLPAAVVLLLLVLRTRIFQPVMGLNRLLQRLAEHDFRPASAELSSPVLRPIIESYNQLVARLNEAEVENFQRRQALESQVRAATETLLRQQRDLATADRLAAVGEMSARIAHELRNPLAGMEMALRNLQADCRRDRCSGEEIHARVGPVIGELQRIARLLNELLEGVKARPMMAVRFNLAADVEEFMALVHYQVPERIALKVDIPREIECCLPRDGFKQALLNLILNAVQAIGDKPGMVEVSARKDGEEIHMTVSDNGPGFPPEWLEFGPRPFATGRPDGTGLGLAMVRRFVTSVGGKMRLANSPDAGAKVILVFPAEQDHAPSALDH